MKIIITGGSGFVGSNLTNFLIKQNHEIVLFVRNKNKLKNITANDNVIIEFVDVTNYSELSKSLKFHKPDVIFHLAGETSHQKSFENRACNIPPNL